jgi:hypothetical protein
MDQSTITIYQDIFAVRQEMLLFWVWRWKQVESKTNQSVNVNKEIITVCSETHAKHGNVLCGQNAEFFNVKSGCT